MTSRDVPLAGRAHASPADTTGVRAGDANPFESGAVEQCFERRGMALMWCTAPAGHDGPHIGAGPVSVLGVWDR